MILENKILNMEEIKQIIFSTPGFFLNQNDSKGNGVIDADELKTKLWGDVNDNHYVKVNDINIAYSLKGDGEPVILLHGMRDSKHIMNPLAESLSSQYKVISVDIRGHGYSERTEGGYSTELFSGDIIALIDELKLNDVTVIGHSLGASLAFEIALKAPEKIKKLVVMGSAVKENLEEYTPVDPEKMVKDTNPMMHSKFLEMLNKKFFSLPKEGEEKDVLERIRETAILTWMMNSQENVLQLIKLKRTSLDKEINKISCPVLVLNGERDIVGTAEQADYIKGAVKNTSVEVIPNAGHYMYLEYPEQAFSAINKFMGS